MRNAPVVDPSPTPILQAAQRRVIALFARLDAPGREAGPEQNRLFHELQQELGILMDVEEELYYPALRKLKGEFARRVVARALQDHGELKALLQGLTLRVSRNRSLGSKLTALRKCVLSHFDLEESQMVPYLGALPQGTLHELGLAMETMGKRLRMNHDGTKQPRRVRDVFYPTLQDSSGAPEDDRENPHSLGSPGELNERHSSDFDTWGSE
jgi:hypothetical protein